MNYFTFGQQEKTKPGNMLSEPLELKVSMYCAYDVRKMKKLGSLCKPFQRRNSICSYGDDANIHQRNYRIKFNQGGVRLEDERGTNPQRNGGINSN